MKYILFFIIPLLTNGAVILPSLFSFDPPTGEKLVCSADTNELNLMCFNSARLKIVTAKSGSQSRNICGFPEDLVTPLAGSCHEMERTLKFLKEKCDGKEKCSIKLDEPVPNNCANNLSKYIQVSYKCTTSFLPFRPFLKERIGVDMFKTFGEFQEEKMWRKANSQNN